MYLNPSEIQPDKMSSTVLQYLPIKLKAGSFPRGVLMYIFLCLVYIKLQEISGTEKSIFDIFDTISLSKNRTTMYSLLCRTNLTLFFTIYQSKIGQGNITGVMKQVYTTGNELNYLCLPKSGCKNCSRTGVGSKNQDLSV